MRIELFYFDGCPSYLQALKNLEEALRQEDIHEKVLMIRVGSEADARTKRFVGSPTIRIDGADLQGPQAEANGYGFGCRVYPSNGKSTGWPPVQMIRRALQLARRPRRKNGASILRSPV